jgi:hypothetical protein
MMAFNVPCVAVQLSSPLDFEDIRPGYHAATDKGEERTRTRMQMQERMRTRVGLTHSWNKGIWSEKNAQGGMLHFLAAGSGINGDVLSNAENYPHL